MCCSVLHGRLGTNVHKLLKKLAAKYTIKHWMVCEHALICFDISTLAFQGYYVQH